MRTVIARSVISLTAIDLLVLVEHVQQLDTGVVAALQSFEHGGVGVAPHLSGIVRVSNTAAHTHRHTTEGVCKRARLPVRPCFQNSGGD